MLEYDDVFDDLKKCFKKTFMVSVVFCLSDRGAEAVGDGRRHPFSVRLHGPPE